MSPKEQNVFNTFYYPQKIGQNNNPPEQQSLNNTKSQFILHNMNEQSQSSVALLSTFQNTRHLKSSNHQLPHLLEVSSSSPPLRAPPSQASILIEGGGLSPDRHAKEFLAARLNSKIKANPSLQQVEPKAVLSSHNRTGNQFLGSFKRNSNALFTNNNQIMPPVNPPVIYESSSANIIKPCLEKGSPSPETRFGGSSSLVYMVNNKFGHHHHMNMVQQQQQKSSNRFTIKDLQ